VRTPLLIAILVAGVLPATAGEIIRTGYVPPYFTLHGVEAGDNVETFHDANPLIGDIMARIA
jgi:hypothetical protein